MLGLIEACPLCLCRFQFSAAIKASAKLVIQTKEKRLGIVTRALAGVDAQAMSI